MAGTTRPKRHASDASDTESCDFRPAKHRKVSPQRSGMFMTGDDTQLVSRLDEHRTPETPVSIYNHDVTSDGSTGKAAAPGVPAVLTPAETRLPSPSRSNTPRAKEEHPSLQQEHQGDLSVNHKYRISLDRESDDTGSREIGCLVSDISQPNSEQPTHLAMSQLVKEAVDVGEARAIRDTTDSQRLPDYMQPVQQYLAIREDQLDCGSDTGDEQRGYFQVSQSDTGDEQRGCFQVSQRDTDDEQRGSFGTIDNELYDKRSGRYCTNSEPDKLDGEQRVCFGSTKDELGNEQKEQHEYAGTTQEELQVSQESKTSCHDYVTLGPAISPPTSVYTRPEYVYEDHGNPNFSEELRTAFLCSEIRQDARRYKYGAAVADVWKRGFTPEEAREEWERARAITQADLDNVSDSEEELERARARLGQCQ